jgi:hypothetical protein
MKKLIGPEVGWVAQAVSNTAALAVRARTRVLRIGSLLGKRVWGREYYVWTADFIPQGVPEPSGWRVGRAPAKPVHVCLHFAP